MMWFFAILIVLALGGIALVASRAGARPSRGRTTTGPTSLVPEGDDLVGDDLRRVRFTTVLRGYRMSEVDTLLERLATPARGGPSTRRGSRTPPTARLMARSRTSRAHSRVPLSWIVYILTALAGVVVVLTRVRLGGDKASAGRLQISKTLLNTHTIVGLAALMTWIVFLVTGAGDKDGNSLIGIAGLALFWVTTIAGLMILVRWLPSRGKHSAAAVLDEWSEGPGLSILAHVGMLVGVSVFTWAYLTSAV